MSGSLSVDHQLVETWAARQASPLTRISYRHQGKRLLARLGVPLAEATVADLQRYVASLGDLAPSTIGLAVASVKSLYAFGRLTGALSADPTATLQAPPAKNVLAERILEEEDVRRMIAGEAREPERLRSDPVADGGGAAPTRAGLFRLSLGGAPVGRAGFRHHEKHGWDARRRRPRGRAGPSTARTQAVDDEQRMG